MGGRRGTVAERFWRAVAIAPNGCWEWQLSRDAKGYGQFGLTPQARRTASRMSWELTYGPIPSGLCALHRCDNPPCVRPSHLFLGTRGDNWRDMKAKGRHFPPPRMVGASNPAARLNDDLVRLIQGDRSPAAVWATALGVSASTIERVRRGGWTFVEEVA